VRPHRGEEAGEPAEPLSRKREIVLTFGQKALLENEAWLRAHRERPVSRSSAAELLSDVGKAGLAHCYGSGFSKLSSRFNIADSFPALAFVHTGTNGEIRKH
jgi:hypothetical protein